MDPYRDIIPDNDGEDIRKRVRERDGSDDEGLPTKRPRANTSALLPPKPEDDLERYDCARLQQGLRYIDGAAKRKITPRTQEFLRLHKDAYKVALVGEAPKTASRAVVQALDKVYDTRQFHFKSRSSEEHERLMNYVKLRQLELLAHYGDYLEHEASLFRADLKEAASGVHSDNSEIRAASRGLSGPSTWTDIADKLAGADVTGLRKNVYGACDALGIDPEHMLWLIEEWAQRNRVFHNSIRQYISECRWHYVAKQICHDLKELPNVAPDHDTAVKYERVLLKIRSDYFNVKDPYDPDYWVPNEKAIKLMEEKVAKDKKKAEKK